MLEEILTVVAPLFSFWMQSSLILTALQIRQDRNMHQLSVLPFLTILVNCTVWMIYGYFMKEWSLFASNVIGVVVGIFGTVTYEVYSFISIPTSYYILSFSIMGSAFVFGMMKLVVVLGMMGVFLAIAVYAAPLATIRTVLKDKSTESMPFAICLTAWLSSLAWTLYGGVVVDWNVLVPSIIGLCLATTQLALYGIYGFHPPVLTKQLEEEAMR